MTAEVAILNKGGVALAADSTVTITTENGDKTYNTANKLFTLSKHHPVGIMIWNGTEFTGTPLELVIKEFREALGKKSKGTIAEYGRAFIAHLRAKSHVSKQDEARNFANVMNDFCRSIKNDWIERCRNTAASLSPMNKSQDTDDAFVFVLDQFEENIKDAKRNPNFQGITPEQLQTRYPGVVTGIIDRLFKLTPPKPSRKKRFAALLHRAALSNYMSDDFSGIVIAGYGEDEHYPSLVSYETDGKYAGRVKLSTDGVRTITNQNYSRLIPFAQRRAANLFMEGVDLEYQQYINESAAGLIVGLADVAGKHFGIVDKKKIDVLRKELETTALDYLRHLVHMRRAEIHKVMEAVRVLDKAEMAVLAENIVSLTALKQKVSLETETVGGPVDVAFISKNDGFIWIKRKHYFDASLNPFFFQKYLATK